jgi:carbon storage regulator CsrA
MLVLTRKAGEAIRIAEDIEIVFQEVRGDRVKIGIEAAKMICVLRGELLGAPPKVVERTTPVCGDTDRATSRKTVGSLNN